MVFRKFSIESILDLLISQLIFNFKNSCCDKFLFGGYEYVKITSSKSSSEKFESSIFEVEYENLVINNQDEIKKIINFCGLEWEDKCLAFHKNTNPIKTMSTAQARKPIYKTSLKSFEKYKEYLTFLENNL